MKNLLADLQLFLILALAALFIALLDNFGLLQIPKSLFQTLTVPVQFGLYKTGLGIGTQFTIITQVRNLSLQNRALQKQLSDLLAENAQLRRQLAETQALVDQQNSLNPRTYNLLTARPIGFGRYLSIDRGLEDGLQANQVVIFKDQYLGQIKDLSPKTATVILASDPDSKIAVYSQNSDGRARGVLHGQFGAEGLMDKILHQEPISVDDLIYSEGTEGNLPKGLIVGKVSKVLENQNEVFKQAIIKPVFAPQDLDLVFIIQN